MAVKSYFQSQAEVPEVSSKLDILLYILDEIGADKTPKKVLEIGCRTGGTSRRIAALYPLTKVVGIDKNKHHVQEARKKARLAGLENVEFGVWDVNDRFPYGSDEFDVVVFMGFYPFLESPQKTLRESIRVLKAAGDLALFENSKYRESISKALAELPVLPTFEEATKTVKLYYSLGPEFLIYVGKNRKDYDPLLS